MRKSIIVAGMLLACFSACHQAPKTISREELLKTIDSIETPLMQSAQIQVVDTTEGNKLVGYYVQFADAYPDDSLSPIYLHRAAQVCNGMSQTDNMETYYDRVIDNYPNYTKRVDCFFEKAIALDNAGHKEVARDAYQQLIDEYPDHYFSKDAAKLIELLNMSDQLLSKHLEEMNMN